MCRGVDLGTCIAVGCDQPIPCRDNDGFCNEHNPYDWPDPKPPVPVDNDKALRRQYREMVRAQEQDTTRLGLLETTIRQRQKVLDDLIIKGYAR